AQQRVEPPRLAADDLAEPLMPDPARLRAEVRELGLGRLRREQPDACPLLPRVLGEDELRAIPELEGERRCLGAFLAGPEGLEPPCGHQVDEDQELAVVGGEEKALAAPLHAAEVPA